jgi:hypothetical protein
MKSILKSFALALLAPLAAFASRYMHSAGLVRSMFQGVPTAADFRAYRVTNPNFAEVVRQPLYDYNLMPGAGSQSLAFFQTPVGAGVATALGATVGSVKSYSDTNMELGGQLPSGFEFLCDAIRLEFYPGSVSTASTYTPRRGGELGHYRRNHHERRSSTMPISFGNRGAWNSTCLARTTPAPRR